MTNYQLQVLEQELKARGYIKHINNLTGGEAWAWRKRIPAGIDSTGSDADGYEIMFRVWDFTRFGEYGVHAYEIYFWTSPIGSDFDFSSKWKPICNFDTFEAMAGDFYKMTKKYHTGTSKLYCVNFGPNVKTGKSRRMCIKDRSKICLLCHECDVDVLNPRY